MPDSILDEYDRLLPGRFDGSDMATAFPHKMSAVGPAGRRHLSLWEKEVDPFSNRCRWWVRIPLDACGGKPNRIA